MTREAITWAWKAFFIELWPLWIGVGCAAIYLVAHFLYEWRRDWQRFLAERRMEFGGWLGNQEIEGRRVLESRFNALSSDVQWLIDRNATMLNEFHDTVERRLTVIEDELRSRPKS